MGGHKGSGLNLACELFAACLGGLTMRDARAESGSAINSLLGMCLRADTVPGAFERIEAAIGYFLATRADRVEGPVQLPGDPERRARNRLQRSGLPMSANVWSAIAELAAAAGLAEADIASVPIARG